MSEDFLAGRGWPVTADVRRLDAAFARLQARGILAIHNGPCCDTCVGAYLWGEAVPAAEEAGLPLRGYVFYNEQTSESVCHGGPLFLVCGPIPEPDDKAVFRAAAKDVTAIVREELEASGLRPSLSAGTYCVLQLPIDLRSVAADEPTE